jgi:membrane-bound serine protease (ClpP class)
VVYVTPPGTQSGSAGAFFLSAADVAAMAPDTSFGTPVPLADVDETLSEQTQELVLDSVVQQLRDWNAAQNRNTDWIDAAVRNGVIRTNEQAIATEPPTIDVIARDMDELLTLLEGRTVELAGGEEVQLQALGRSTTPIEPTLWEQFLMLLADPTVAFLLLVLGCIAVYAELATPGTGIAAGIGVVLLIGALVGFLILPIRWISLLGLLLAFAIIAADIYLPTHGGLTVAGLVLLVVSSMTLIDAAQAPNVFVALWAIAVVVLAGAAFVGVIVWLIVRTRNTPIATGQEGLIGRLAEVRKALDPEGFVFVEGALWRAVSEDGTIEPKEWVRIAAVHDLRLVVRRIDTEESAESKAY